MDTTIEHIIEKIKGDQVLNPETRSYIIATYLRPELRTEKEEIMIAWVYGTLEIMHPFKTPEEYFNHTFFK